MGATLPQTKSNCSTSILWGNGDGTKLTSTKVVPSFNVQRRKTHSQERAWPFFTHLFHSSCLTVAVPVRAWPQLADSSHSSVWLPPTFPAWLSSWTSSCSAGAAGLKNGKGLSGPQRKSKLGLRKGGGCSLCTLPCCCVHSSVRADCCPPFLAERLFRHVSPSSRQLSKPAWDPTNRKVLLSQPRLNQTSDLKILSHDFVVNCVLL